MNYSKFKSPMEWIDERFAHGADDRKNYNFYFFLTENNAPFTKYWDIDSWLCESCNKWVEVADYYLFLRCKDCKQICSELNPLLSFGKHKGEYARDTPLSYQQYLTSFRP